MIDKNRIYMKLITNFILFTALLFTFEAYSKENIGQNENSSSSNARIASGCAPSTSQTDLDINNIRTTIMGGGDMWWDLNNAKYEIPKNSNKHSMFAGALWIAGVSEGGQLKVAAQTYRQTGDDFWTGPLDPATGSISASECDEWDQHFKINKSEVEEFVAYTLNPADYPTYVVPDVIKKWPAKGNPLGIAGDKSVAPFHDVNDDGVYNFEDGDYPDFNITGNDIDAELFGDQNIFWVFNDKGNVHTETEAEAIGLEIHAQAFGFATDDEINDMTFYNYKIINRATTKLVDAYFGQWVDPDLGFYLDDYVGCDVTRGLGYCYNGDAEDEGAAGYGLNPPCIGVDFFQGPLADEGDGIDNDRDGLIDEGEDGIDNDADGLIDAADDDEREQIIMSKFVYYNNDFTVTGNPSEAQHFYNYLRAIWKDNVPFTYGGNGKEGTIECDFMFPDDSDPNGWGVGGSIDNPITMPIWSEASEGNIPADRRFLQSAGPFTLQPGAINTITTGVIWARASAGGNTAAVGLVKVFDDKAQALFNNNFKVLDGPDAPDVNIVEMDKELVLYLTNAELSNNYKEGYKEKNPNITHTSDNLFEFQGYKIYQLADNTVSASELDNADRARLIFQCDKEDGIDRIVNQYFDLSTELWFPEIMVDGLNEGVSHSFKITQDQFATGDKTLINHKTYYFMALAYAYNAAEINADPYNPEGSGQNVPYKQSRRNIKVYSAIPHNNSVENQGTIINSQYGQGVELTRIEGSGNGGVFLNFTSSTVESIISNNIDSFPVYSPNFGPLKIKVVDPTSIQPGNFVVMMDTVQDFIGWKLYEQDENGLTFIEESDVSIYQNYEQIITSLGISISMSDITTPSYINPVNSPLAEALVIGSGTDGLTGENGFIGSEIVYSDPTNPWLIGVSDRDENIDDFNNWEWAYNWIRSGNYEHDFGDETPDARRDENDYQWGNNQQEADPEEIYETIINGTWAPYKFASYFHDGPAVSSVVSGNVDLNNLSSVDIVFTQDQTKWTRCIVLESQDLEVFAEGGAKKMFPRKSKNVGKDGNPDGTFEIYDGPQLPPTFGLNVGDTIKDMGMGWFPGYAINLETGERLNMMFAEDSWLWNDNGNDMLWNPTSNLESDAFGPSYDWDGDHVFEGGTYLLGGKHFVYVMNSLYDSCKSYQSTFASRPIGNTISGQIQVFRDAMWVGFPLTAQDEAFESDVSVKIRVNKPFDKYSTSSLPINNDNPAYGFSTNELAPFYNNAQAADSALSLINVVPNPYYAYSSYEENQLDNRIKITNLPALCDINIYTVGGQLIKTINKDDPTITSVDWSLKNEFNIPIASGLYIIHVSVPGVGERVLKWLGVMRPIDLDTF